MWFIYCLNGKTREEESESESERTADDLTIYVSFFIAAIRFSSPIKVSAFFPIILTQYKCSLWQCEKQLIHLTVRSGGEKLSKKYLSHLSIIIHPPRRTFPLSVIHWNIFGGDYTTSRLSVSFYFYCFIITKPHKSDSSPLCVIQHHCWI